MLKQRMYSFVIYQLSGIQAGIQAGHAWMEYARENFNDPDFQQWINDDRTVIILNGGTTNSLGDDFYHPEINYKGDMDEIIPKLIELGVNYSTFYEPDLNSALTSIAFLVDETVWDYEKYPIIRNNVMTYSSIHDKEREIALNVEKYGKDFEKSYKIREFLSNYSLAKN
jgi:hypothetical protein